MVNATLTLALLACRSLPPEPEAGDASRMVAALTQVEQDPQAAAAICQQMTGRGRKDCVWAVVPGLVAEDRAAAEAACASLEGDASAECRFVLAEATGEASDCPTGTPLDNPCRRHLYEEEAIARWGEEPLPAGVHGEMVELADELGTALVPEYRSHIFRVLVGQEHPPRPLSCSLLAGDELRYCQAALNGLYDSYLSRASERGNLPCDGTLPRQLEELDNPSVWAALERAQELYCPT